MKTYKLNWASHIPNMGSVFQTLYESEALCDVTLGCKNGVIKAHKIILSTCSNYFLKMFMENDTKRVIMALPEVDVDVAKTLVTFIYTGSVSVPEDKYQELIDVADLLEIRGLSNDSGPKKKKAKKDEEKTEKKAESEEKKAGEDKTNALSAYLGNPGDIPEGPLVINQEPGEVLPSTSKEESSANNPKAKSNPPKPNNVKSANPTKVTKPSIPNNVTPNNVAPSIPNNITPSNSVAPPSNPNSKIRLPSDPVNFAQNPITGAELLSLFPTPSSIKCPIQINQNPANPATSIPQAASASIPPSLTASAPSSIPPPMSIASSLPSMSLASSLPSMSLASSLPSMSLASSLPSTTTPLPPSTTTLTSMKSIVSSPSSDNMILDEKTGSTTTLKKFRKKIPGKGPAPILPSTSNNDPASGTNVPAPPPVPSIQIDDIPKIMTTLTSPVCPLCSHSFDDEASLRMHLMNIHVNSRPYSCDFCGASFNRASHLARHRRTHTGERPFECSKCGKLFARQDKLKTHFDRHTNKDGSGDPENNRPGVIGASPDGKKKKTTVKRNANGSEKQRQTVTGTTANQPILPALPLSMAAPLSMAMTAPMNSGMVTQMAKNPLPPSGPLGPLIPMTSLAQNQPTNLEQFQQLFNNTAFPGLAKPPPPPVVPQQAAMGPPPTSMALTSPSGAPMFPIGNLISQQQQPLLPIFFQQQQTQQQQ